MVSKYGKRIALIFLYLQYKDWRMSVIIFLPFTAVFPFPFLVMQQISLFFKQVCFEKNLLMCSWFSLIGYPFCFLWGLYPSNFTNACFWKKIEFLNVEFHKKKWSQNYPTMKVGVWRDCKWVYGKTLGGSPLAFLLLDGK